jgi:TetR/AcrR family transcriptional repressor of nem operon
MEDTTAAAVRRTRKGQATHDRIVAVAARLMYDRGVAGTSTEDVQTAARVSASQLYHYFGDKQSLVRAVIAHQTEAILDAQIPLLCDLDSIGALEAWRDFMVDLQRRGRCGGCPIGRLASEWADHDPGARADLADGFARWEAAIRDGLATMRQRGELRADTDPAALALATLAVVQGGLLLTKTRRDTVALEVGLTAMIDHIRSYLAAA